jgi:hypothetical protein
VPVPLPLVPDPPPSTLEQTRSCSLDFEHHNISRIPAIGILGAGHGYLNVTTDNGSYVVEGFNNHGYLNAQETDKGLSNDRPGSDPSYGSVSGSFVRDWLPKIDAAAIQVNRDDVIYNAAQLNSNTVLYYILSQLPPTFTPWFQAPNLIGFKPYPF